MRMREIFDKMKNIAVYGMSANIAKAAHSVPGYMLKRGYKVIPINPNADTILKQQVYRNIMDIPDKIDILNIFRPQEEALSIVQEAVERRKAKGDIKLIWLQLGLKNEEAKQLAKENGIDYIEDKCMYIEHKKVVEN
ncbi:MAG: CoA-binding protein [Candidatus Kapaibacterium sp.]